MPIKLYRLKKICASRKQTSYVIPLFQINEDDFLLFKYTKNGVTFLSSNGLFSSVSDNLEFQML